MTRDYILQKLQAEQVHHILKLGNRRGLHYDEAALDKWWKRVQQL